LEGTVKDSSWHGSGHSDKSASGSVTGFIIMTMIFLYGSALYFMYRVYKLDKRFSGDWIKEFGA